MKVTDLEVAKKMLMIKKSADERGLEYDISFRKMKQLLERDACYYTDAKFEEHGPRQRSIDRVDNEIGYVDSNVIAVSVDFNNKKKNLTFEEIKLLYFKTKNFLDKKRTAKVQEVEEEGQNDTQEDS